MSEYQYYEFVALDRPLTSADQAELRALSSRAEISATRFRNTYNYGSFRGDTGEVLARWFDAHVYVSNFGVYQVMFRLPKEAVDLEAWRPYLGETVTATTRRDHVVVTLSWTDEDGGDWIDDAQAEGWMSSLLPLRERLLRGDLAPLYVGWLRGAWDAYEPDEAGVEPPVPPGLRAGNAALHALANFLGIDDDVFEAAAEASADDPATSRDVAAVTAWVEGLAVTELRELVARVMRGEGVSVEAELTRRFAAERRAAVGAAPAPTRTFAQIEARALELQQVRKLAKAAERERARLRREKAEAAELAKRLDALAPRKADAWREVEDSVGRRDRKGYERAVELLVDLHALATRDGDLAGFSDALTGLRGARPSAAFDRRLNEAKLL